MRLEIISYEQARKEFFEKELVHKHAQLTYWLRKHDHWKCEKIGGEISYIEDALKALGNEEKHLCLTCAENRYGVCETQNLTACKNYRRNTEC